MAGLFSNKYDVEQGINDAMTKTALSYGAIDRSAYAPMTASTALQGDMAGRGISMMLGGQDPMAAKQSAVDAIMQKYPNPDTPEEMNKIADELGQAGFPDLGMEVRNVGIELQKTETKLTTPSKNLLDQIDTQLGASILTDEFVDSFMLFKNKGVAFNIGTKAEDGDLTQGAYDTKKGAAKKELQAQFTQFRNSLSRDKKMTINEINNLLSNTEALTTEFKKWAKTQGNDRARWLDENMSSANPRTNMTSTGDSVNSNLQDELQSTTASNISPEELENAEIQATAILTEKSSDAEQEQIFNDLQKIVDANYFQGDGALERALDPTQLIMYQRLQEKFGSKSSMNSSAFSNPDSQMWFQEMLGDVGQEIV
mgnify:CR=1 FL=1